MLRAPDIVKLGLGGLLGILLTGCLSPREKVAQRLPAIRAQWQADVSHQAALPERAIAWPEAVTLLEAGNLKLRSARNGITNSQELARQPYRDLIPMVDLRSGLSKSIKSIPSTSADDVTFNIDSFFNVPGIVNFDSRLFAGKLAVLRARAAYQLARREQIIELYKVFVEAQENEEVATELKSERVLAQAVQKADALNGQALLKEIQGRQLSLAESRARVQTRLGELLDNPQYRWVPATNGLPEFTYENQPLPLTDTNRVAQLQMKLVALELVAAWAQVHGIKLQYWPELAIFVTGPSVYQRVNGVSHFWSTADITASADFFWNLDTRGYVRMQLRQTRREQELEKARLRQDSLALIDRLLAAQKLEGSLREQVRQLDQLLANLGKIPQSLDFNSVLQAIETNRSLRQQQLKLRRDLAELNTLFWFVDETKWPA